MQELSQEDIAFMATKTVKDTTMEKMFRQIGDEVVEYTAEEYAQVEIDKIEAKRLADEAAAKIAHKVALLERLGITEEEAKLLIG